MRGPWSLALVGCVLAIPPSLGSAKAQTQTGTVRPGATSSTPTIPRVDGRDPEGLPDPQAALMEARRVRSLAMDRQKKIVDDVTRLAQLAGEVKTSADQANKETSADVIRKTEEIEKLARDVKQRMKG